jgi:hypothetical protein
MKISQMINGNGRPAANQFIINTENGQIFQSYDRLIAYADRSGDTPILSDYWDYSKTTLKHLKLFFNWQLTKKQIETMIKAGSIIVTSETKLNNYLKG